jgi:predicted RNA binding protein YcfA (HicA-like mRNA interferase family)
MNARELIQLLREKGWEELRQKGSHRIFKHPELPDNIAVPDHGAKDLHKGLVHRILKQAGLK